jgi:inorganic pyrophosphatase
MNIPPTFSKKDNIHVVIETPAGSRNKYAYDEGYGGFILKKVLPEATIFPMEMGFICRTKGEDGDPLDALILMDRGTYPGCLVECRVIGVITATQKEKKRKKISASLKFHTNTRT